jgi:hypothetical protein
MARYKAHKEDLELGKAVCATTHRTLLPLLLTSNWDEVTCAKCLRHLPPQPVRSTRERLIANLRRWMGLR